MIHNPRYGPYDGGPDPLAPPVDLREALAAIGDDVLSGTSPRHALRELLRRGNRDMRGLDDLAAQANRRRRELLRRNNLDGTLDEVRKLLDKAVLEERKELARALDDDARFNEMRIEELPPSTAQAVQDLADYNWRSEQARADYEKIRDLLGREVLDQRFSGMKQALEGATDEDREQIRQMLADLNQTARRALSGCRHCGAVCGVHGQARAVFPGPTRATSRNFWILWRSARRLHNDCGNSLSQEQRDELDALAQQAFGDPSLMSELSQLDQFLQAARPGEDWKVRKQFRGDNGMGLGEGTSALQDIAELESLADQLSQQYAGAALDDIDPELLARQLGDEAAADARTPG